MQQNCAAVLSNKQTHENRKQKKKRRRQRRDPPGCGALALAPTPPPGEDRVQNPGNAELAGGALARSLVRWLLLLLLHTQATFNPRFRQRHFPSKATCDLRQEGSDPQVKVKLEQTFPEPRVKKSSGGFNLYVDRQTRRGRGKRQKRPVRDDRPLTQSEECEPSGAAGRTVPPVLWHERRTETFGEAAFSCWTNLDPSGPVWTSLDRSGRVWTNLDQSGPVWTSLDRSGRVWTNLDQLGPVRTRVDRSGRVWTNLNPSRPVWTSLDRSGRVWTHLDQSGPTWTSPDPCG
ncbi:hypothetical protein F2P81_020598 [Scophthalmus maximus]|uniref:Uncharacterized protein n=1 Tax=Scophthalmus maximus TaxID=52904 RepID=A0A6A4S493_SCOMX|nr:hypothetical protein F2P81_020598 [Scophthalmus maximus]